MDWKLEGLNFAHPIDISICDIYIKKKKKILSSDEIRALETDNCCPSSENSIPINAHPTLLPPRHPPLRVYGIRLKAIEESTAAINPYTIQFAFDDRDPSW